MTLHPFPIGHPLGAFLFAFPALFSIVNPLGAALIFNEVTDGRTRAERHALAGRIAIYAALVLLGSLWLGGYILSFFGISLGALRVAGGLVVAISAWGLLMKPKEQEDRKAGHAASAEGYDDVAFFPLTMPFTTGPGTIAVAVALASERPPTGEFGFFLGLSAAAAAIAIVVWFAYREADRIMALLGPTGARVVSRLVAFLLLCVGVQIISTGVASLAVAILHPPA